VEIRNHVIIKLHWEEIKDTYRKSHMILHWYHGCIRNNLLSCGKKRETIIEQNKMNARWLADPFYRSVVKKKLKIFLLTLCVCTCIYLNESERWWTFKVCVCVDNCTYIWCLIMCHVWLISAWSAKVTCIFVCCNIQQTKDRQDQSERKMVKVQGMYLLLWH